MTGLFNLRVVVLGGLLAMVCVVAFVLARGGLSFGPAEQVGPATPSSSGLAVQATLPPIDAAAPAKTETATFALG